ncbi:MAG: hypothetical protein KAI77_03740 [Gammaproteobacteria bacterium]|nr:hypothetical protein [Gammaproteobacteria bacterium]
MVRYDNFKILGARFANNKIMLSVNRSRHVLLSQERRILFMYHNETDTKMSIAGIGLLVVIIVCNIALATVTKGVLYKSSDTVTKEKRSADVDYSEQYWTSPGFDLMP